MIGIDGHHVGGILETERFGLLFQRGQHVDRLSALHRRAGTRKRRVGKIAGRIVRTAAALLHRQLTRAELIGQTAEMAQIARLAEMAKVEIVARVVAAQDVAAIVTTRVDNLA